MESPSSPSAAGAGAGGGAGGSAGDGAAAAAVADDATTRHDVLGAASVWTRAPAPGDQVWVPNPYAESDGEYRREWLPASDSDRPIWVPALVHSVVGVQTSSMRVVASASLHPPVRVEHDLSQVHPRSAEHYRISNLMDLPHQDLNEPSILALLARRFTKKQIFTQAGPILIAINPYELISDDVGVPIYDHSVMYRYRSRPPNESLRLLSSRERAQRCLPPHLFATADDAHQALLCDQQSQTVLFQGESGSGKTEAAKTVLQYFINTSQSLRAASSGDANQGALSNVERIIWRANDVLEAFGNASTASNTNSSRFGLITRLHFSSTGSIIGGDISHTLLGARRVMERQAGERNFHIFHQLLAGASDEERLELGLKPSAWYQCMREDEEALGDDEAAEDDADDALLFRQVRASMGIVGINDSRQMDVLRLLSGIMALGNVSFVEDVDGNLKPADLEPLMVAAKALELDQELLVQELTTKSSTDTPATSKPDTPSTSQLKPEAALERVKAFASFLYDQLFAWLIVRINASLEAAALVGGAPPVSLDDVLSIRLVDLYGFEDSAWAFDQAAIPSKPAVMAAPNQLFQLLTNYTAEKLAAFMRAGIDKNESALYVRERVRCDAPALWDNSNVVNIIDSMHRPTGVIALLDEACLYHLNAGSFLMKLDHLKRHTEYKRAPPALCRAGGFIIEHSRQPVLYSVEDFVRSNRAVGASGLPASLAALCTATPPDSLVNRIATTEGFGAQDMDEAASSASGRRPFLSTTFKNCITRLFASLRRTNVHHIICLRPNTSQRGCFVEPDVLVRQLYAVHVSETMRSLQAGFHHRFPLAEFYERYVVLDYGVMSSHKTELPENLSLEVLRSGCQTLLHRAWAMVASPPRETSLDFDEDVRLLDGLHAMDDVVQVGITTVFMRDSMLEAIEKARRGRLAALDSSAVQVQKLYRVYRDRNLFVRGRAAVVQLQAAARGRAVRQQVTETIRSGDAIKRFFLMLRERERFQSKRESATLIKQFYTAYRQRTSFIQLRISALTVHVLARGFIMRRQIIRKAASLKRLQRFARVFLVKNRIHWARVRGALMMQAAWRGFYSRLANGEVVDHVDAFRRRKAKEKFFRLLFATFKGRLVRERFLVMREAAIFLQRFFRTRQARRWFTAARASAPKIQAMVRGRLARHMVSNVRSLNMAADEAWQVHTIRSAEAAQLIRTGTELHSAAFWQTVTSSGSESGASIQLKGLSGSGAPKWARSMHRIVDIDIPVDTSDVYPQGWMQHVGALEKALLKRGHHTQAVALGDSHTLLLTSEGEILSFGWADRGQLGQSDRQNLVRPAEIRHVSVGKVMPGPRILHKVKFKAIAAGSDHSLALSSDGRVFSWGANNRGQLGLGHRRPVLEPTHMVEMRRKLAAVACGAQHSVLLTSAGSIYTCGSGHSAGFPAVPRTEDGDGGDLVVQDVLVPTGLKSLSRFSIKDVSCGYGHTLALSHAGDMYSWGSGEQGQLGLGRDKSRLVPGLIQRDITEWQADDDALEAVVEEHARAVAEAELKGEAPPGLEASPAALAKLQALAQANAESRDRMIVSAAVSGGGAGMLPPFRFSAVACGARHSVALTSSGRVYTWGCNANGQLGLGDRRNRNVPTAVEGSIKHTRCIQVAAGWRHSVVLTREHVLYEWGHAGAVSEKGLRHSLDLHLNPRDPESYLEAVESLVPNRVFVKGAEGYQSDTLCVAWSRNMSVTSSFYSTSRQTTAMVEAVMARLADDTEALLLEDGALDALDDGGLDSVLDAEEKEALSPPDPISPTTARLRTSSRRPRPSSPHSRAALLASIHVPPPSGDEVDSLILVKHPEVSSVLRTLRGEVESGLSPDDMERGRTMVETLRDHYRLQLLRAREEEAIAEVTGEIIEADSAAAAENGMEKSSEGTRGKSGADVVEDRLEQSFHSTRKKKPWQDMTPQERFRSLRLTKAHLAALSKEQLSNLALALRATTHDAARPHITPSKKRLPEKNRPLAEQLRSHSFRVESPDKKTQESRWDSQHQRAKSWNRRRRQGMEDPGSGAAGKAGASAGSGGGGGGRAVSAAVAGTLKGFNPTPAVARPTAPEKDTERALAESGERYVAAKRQQLTPFQSMAMSIAQSAKEQEAHSRRNPIPDEALPASKTAAVVPPTIARAVGVGGIGRGLEDPSGLYKPVPEQTLLKSQLLVGGRYDMAETQRAAMERARKAAALHAEKERRRTIVQTNRQKWREEIEGSHRSPGKRSAPKTELGASEPQAPPERVTVEGDYTSRYGSRDDDSDDSQDSGAMGLFSSSLLVSTRNPSVSVRQLKAKRQQRRRAADALGNLREIQQHGKLVHVYRKAQRSPSDADDSELPPPRTPEAAPAQTLHERSSKATTTPRSPRLSLAMGAAPPPPAHFNAATGSPRASRLGGRRGTVDPSFISPIAPASHSSGTSKWGTAPASKSDAPPPPPPPLPAGHGRVPSFPAGSSRGQLAPVRGMSGSHQSEGTPSRRPPPAPAHAGPQADSPEMASAVDRIRSQIASTADQVWGSEDGVLFSSASARDAVPRSVGAPEPTRPPRSSTDYPTPQPPSSWGARS